MKLITLVLLSLVLSACTSTSPSLRSPTPDQRSGTEVGVASAPGPRLVAPETVSDLKEVEQFASRLPVASTLVVFDIDDTLLTTVTISSSGDHAFYGGDHWYLWQDKQATDLDKVGPCLLDLVEMNYAISPLEATQRDAAKIVARIPNDKLILTSRGPANRDNTIRELRRAEFKPLQPTPTSNPLDSQEPAGGGKTRWITYSDGIMMTSGLNKGEMLLRLLKHAGREYANVILVDDTSKHISNMRAALAAQSKPAAFYGFRYVGIKNDNGLDNGAGLVPPTPQQIGSHHIAYQAMRSLIKEISPASYGKLEACSTSTFTAPSL